VDELFFEKTVNFIKEHRKQTPDKPFFAMLSTQIAHAPVLPDPKFNGKTQCGPRGDFIYQLDDITGRFLDLLKELKIDDNTLVIFNADNGAEVMHTVWMREDYSHDAVGGYRGMKRDGWEGGHRVPMLFRWPAKIPKGVTSKQMINTTDIFATLAAVTGYHLNDEDAVDSFDMLPVLLGKQKEEDSVRPHMLTQSARGDFQLRVGDWKYLDHVGSGGNNYNKSELEKYVLPEKAPEAKGQLYDLAEDLGETNNLYFSQAVKREEMQKLLRILTEKEGGRTAPLGR
jgi:arylsulfatase A-like enzyme